jgi:fatty-acyl-CoA synthase
VGDPELDEREAAADVLTRAARPAAARRRLLTRSSVLHALGVGANNPLGLGLGIGDAVMPVVPMFHANAWGYPYLATLQGAKLVYPGPHLDADSLLDDMEQERVSWAAGVPTIWMGILARLDEEPGRWDLSAVKAMLIGGSAVPRALIAAFEERHGLRICQGWGMTETSPVASTVALPYDLADADEDTRWDFQATAGIRSRSSRSACGPATKTCRGTARRWASSRCAGRGSPRVLRRARVAPTAGRRRLVPTGDIVSIHPRGFIQIKDRSKDVIKSGGEWISSVELENALMAHPAVAEAAVIAVPDEKWASGRSPRSCSGGRLGDARRAARVPRAALREVVAARPVRVHRGDPEDERRQVPQARAARTVHDRAARTIEGRRSPGGRRAVRAARRAGPEAGERQAVVRVRAAGLNFLDVLIRHGRYPQMPELPACSARSSPASSTTGRA